VPFCAVISVVIVLIPTFRAIGADTAPLASVVPFIFMVALGSVVAGVIVNELVVLLTDAV